uniref:Glycosyl hydrolase family 31 C-terminal domain-containing protein n=1 Tax=Knipowitschia caucasica TaxID=637954 RepID=A0AAV2L0V5_KNICA
MQLLLVMMQLLLVMMQLLLVMMQLLLVMMQLLLVMMQLLLMTVEVLRSFEVVVVLRSFEVVVVLRSFEVVVVLRSFEVVEVLNITRQYIARHQKTAIPLIEKYAEEWRLTGQPIFRPMWWLSPSDPLTYTIDDQFLIGDELLVAPVVERGAVHRDIYLPDGGFQWQDSLTAQVFDGGTLLQDYSVALEEVAVFKRRS